MSNILVSFICWTKHDLRDKKAGLFKAGSHHTPWCMEISGYVCLLLLLEPAGFTALGTYFTGLSSIRPAVWSTSTSGSRPTFVLEARHIVACQAERQRKCRFIDFVIIVVVLNDTAALTCGFPVIKNDLFLLLQSLLDYIIMYVFLTTPETFVLSISS